MKGRVIRQAPGANAPTSPGAEVDRTRVLRAEQRRSLVAAEAHLSEARARAEALIAAAREQGATLRREAAEAGQLAALQAVAAAQRQAQEAGTAWLKAVEDELIALGVAIAEKLLAAALELAPERVAEVAAAVLRAPSCGPPLMLRAHPDDLEHLRAALPNLQRAAQTTALALIADAAVTRGGVVVEGAHALRDGQLATQLSTVARSLAGPTQGATAKGPP
ncbi:MAG: hypothetical protein IPL40_12135 [Proteobacteria bacterium]|nr:hypothetical protein [Pseudomonadota bacterium]